MVLNLILFSGTAAETHGTKNLEAVLHGIYIGMLNFFLPKSLKFIELKKLCSIQKDNLAM